MLVSSRSVPVVAQTLGPTMRLTVASRALTAALGCLVIANCGLAQAPTSPRGSRARGRCR